jgi:hypothetical protein
MDIEKVKLIVKNMESLVRILKEELEEPQILEENGVITPIEEDYDEVY